MLTITYVYERPDDSSPFWVDTEEGSAIQSRIESMGSSSGLLVSYNSSNTPNNLSKISTYVYNNAAECKTFFKMLQDEMPDFKTQRNAYIIEKLHSLTGTATEPLFLDFSNDPPTLTDVLAIPDARLPVPTAALTTW